MRRGGGVGYDFSRIRPRAPEVTRHRERGLAGRVSYMHVFDQSCATVESAGARRGAQMGVLRMRPSRRDGIHRRQATGRRAGTTSTSRSASTDAFMRAVEADEAGSILCTPPSRASPRSPVERTSARMTASGSTARIRARELWRHHHAKSTYESARTRRALPRPHQCGEQSPLLRAHRGDEPVRGEAAAAATDAAAWEAST